MWSLAFPRPGPLFCLDCQEVPIWGATILARDPTSPCWPRVAEVLIGSNNALIVWRANVGQRDATWGIGDESGDDGFEDANTESVPPNTSHTPSRVRTHIARAWA